MGVGGPLPWGIPPGEACGTPVGVVGTIPGVTIGVLSPGADVETTPAGDRATGIPLSDGSGLILLYAGDSAAGETSWLTLYLRATAGAGPLLVVVEGAIPGPPPLYARGPLVTLDSGAVVLLQVVVVVEVVVVVVVVEVVVVVAVKEATGAAPAEVVCGNVGGARIVGVGRAKVGVAAGELIGVGYKVAVGLTSGRLAAEGATVEVAAVTVAVVVPTAVVRPPVLTSPTTVGLNPAPW